MEAAKAIGDPSVVVKGAAERVVEEGSGFRIA